MRKKKLITGIIICAMLALSACGTQDAGGENVVTPTITGEAGDITGTADIQSDKDGNGTEKAEGTVTPGVTNGDEPTEADKPDAAATSGAGNETKEPSVTSDPEATKSPDETVEPGAEKEPDISVTPEAGEEEVPDAVTPSVTGEPVDGTQENEEKPDKTVTTEIGIDENTYFNEALGFEITFPDNWEIFDYETTLAVMYNSYAALYNDVDSMLEAFESVGIDYPLYASSSAVDASGFVDNVLCQSMPYSIVKEYGIEEYVNSLISSSVAQYKQLGAECNATAVEIIERDSYNIYTADSFVKIDGTFAGQEFEDSTIYQKYIAFTCNDYFINVIVSYYNAADAIYAEEILDGIVVY